MSWVITIKEVKDFCGMGICEVVWGSSLQPQTLSRLVPINPSKNQYHETILQAAKTFYENKGKVFEMP